MLLLILAEYENVVGYHLCKRDVRDLGLYELPIAKLITIAVCKSCADTSSTVFIKALPAIEFVTLPLNMDTSTGM
nr:hypothetical protein [Tanacetum cinerariifolium]